MKRYLISFAALVLSSVLAFAQDLSFSFDFTYKVDTQVPVIGSGKVLLKNDCYHVVLDSVDYWCDGQTCWIVDDDSKEVYIDYPADYSEYLKTAEISYSGNVPSRAVIKMEDGSKATLTIKNYVPNPSVDRLFSFDVKSLSSDYVVTDIR